MEPYCPRWEALLVFRDYLRAHPEAARAHADIKRALAASSKDNIEAYRNGKTLSSKRQQLRLVHGARMQEHSSTGLGPTSEPQYPLLAALFGHAETA
jgi:GrpB protein